MNSQINIRAAKIEDAVRLLEIYSYYVKETAITYEYEVPLLDEFKQRISHTLETHPYIVAESDGEIIGYAYAGKYHPRAAYSWDAETTIYLDNNFRGNGVGRKLYSYLEEILKVQGFVKAIALITPPMTEADNDVYRSVHFHENMGYKLSGRLTYSGYKFGRWFDTVTMDKMLCEPHENMESVKAFDEVRGKFGI